jgi:uncharacterized protein (TIGR03067 family)
MEMKPIELLVLFAFVLASFGSCGAEEKQAAPNSATPAAETAGGPQAADGVAILGRWAFVSMEEDGEVERQENLKEMEIKFTSDLMIFRDPKVYGQPDRDKYKLNESKKWIEIAPKGDEAKKFVALYELKGNDLRICMNNDPESSEQPTAFKSEPQGPNGMLLTLRRVVIGTDSASKQDLEDFQGTWKIEYTFAGGKRRELPGATVEFDGEDFLKRRGVGAQPEREFEIRLDASKSPKQIDLHNHNINVKCYGLYELNGNELKICFNERSKSDADRVVGLNPDPAKREVLIVLRKEAK